jgi:hypothetical protein
VLTVFVTCLLCLKNGVKILAKAEIDLRDIEQVSKGGSRL